MYVLPLLQAWYSCDAYLYSTCERLLASDNGRGCSACFLSGVAADVVRVWAQGLVEVYDGFISAVIRLAVTQVYWQCLQCWYRILSVYMCVVIRTRLCVNCVRWFIGGRLVSWVVVTSAGNPGVLFVLEVGIVCYVAPSAVSRVTSLLKLKQGWVGGLWAAALHSL